MNKSRIQQSCSTFILAVTILMIPGSLTNRGYAQTPDFVWAKGAGGKGDYKMEGADDFGYDISIDDEGNSIITGSFGLNASFDTITLSGYGCDDIFIAKYDPSGKVLWAKEAGGRTIDRGKAIATDKFGNSIITGYFSRPAKFGPYILTSAGDFDIFIAKYDASGNVLWAKQAGGTGDDRQSDVGVDAFGNCFVTGGFSGSMTFGTITLTSAGDKDIFIAKYDASGNVLWAKRAGGINFDQGVTIATNELGNSIIIGNCSTTATFDTTILTNARGFIAKYDASGNVLWVKPGGGGSIAWNGLDDFVVTGSFSGSTTVGAITLTSVGGRDIFTVKYDESGNVLWAKQAGGLYDDCGNGIALDELGNCIVTGYFSYSASFDTITLASSGHRDDEIFMVKYDAWGNVLWAKKAGGIENDCGKSIALDGSGNSIITGYFYSYTSVTFDAITLKSFGGNDIFIAKIEELPPTSITVLSPNGGETWQVGKSSQIKWTGNTMVGNVIISLSTNAGETWWKLPDGTGVPTPNDGEYWYTPVVDNISDQCLIRVTSAENPTAEDQSDAVFSIVYHPPEKSYQTYKIPDDFAVPTIDGVLNEPIWNFAIEDSLLFGGVPDAWGTHWTNWNDNLVTWKAVWSDVTNKLYVAVKIVDDVRGNFDNNDPSAENYYPWEDESIEFFTDGDHSGGDYSGRYDAAQQWRVSGENKRNLNNYPSSEQTGIYAGSNFITAITAGENGNWICEAVLTIYNELPAIPKTMTEGDTIGWNIWHNDSDNETHSAGYYSRDHQTGWLYIGPAWSNADYFGNLILGSDETVPVELISFTITLKAEGAILNWCTATEQNNYGFEVQRSIDQKIANAEWEKIGFVSGKGTSTSPNDYSFIDRAVVAGKSYYRLKQIDSDGKFEYSPVVTLEYNPPPTYQLSHNNPNPFNAVTRIDYQIADLKTQQSYSVTLKIFNLSGQVVKTLIDDKMKPGTYSAFWEGHDENGCQVSTGIYLLVMKTEQFVASRKMVLLR